MSFDNEEYKNLTQNQKSTGPLNGQEEDLEDNDFEGSPYNNLVAGDGEGLNTIVAK